MKIAAVSTLFKIIMKYYDMTNAVGTYSMDTSSASHLTRFAGFFLRVSPGHCGKTTAVHRIRIYMPDSLLSKQSARGK